MAEVYNPFRHSVSLFYRVNVWLFWSSGMVDFVGCKLLLHFLFG